MSLLIKDGISPALKKLAGQAKDKKPLLEAMGLQLVSLTKRAFTDEGLRPSPWPPRKPRKNDDGHSLLRKSGALWHSIRIAELTNSFVTVGSDRPYAAAQQFGSKKGLPPRPFFPFRKDGAMTAPASRKVEGVLRAKLNAMGFH